MENWIDRQIREATERGDFDDLPGAGKPIPNLDRPFTAEQWAADWVQREGGDLSAMLPPLLALRKERSRLLALLAEVPTEALLRETVTDFNRRLLEQYRRPQSGPVVPVGVLDVEDTVTAWRSLRPEPAPPTPAPQSARSRSRRRWWRGRPVLD